MKRLTIKEFIEKAKQIHGDKYDYSKVEYINNHTKVCIICPEHGDFWQTPKAHLNGQGCPFCSHMSYKYDVNDVKKIINEKYDNFFSTDSITEYKNNKQKLKLICPIHGEFFSCLNDLKNGHSCPKCGLEKNRKSITKNIQQFISEAKHIHGDKYDYSKVDYINALTKICIICPEHGEFWQTPNEHLKGKGCHICNVSKLENFMQTFLVKNNILFECHKKFKWLGKQHLDFYLPEYNVAIECQGGQHFKPIAYFGGKPKFSKQKKLDEYKQQLCNDNGVKLLYFTKENVDYFNGNKIFKSVNDILEEIK